MKNSVFHANVDTRAWLIAALIRALKTVAQTMLAMIPAAAAINAIDWRTILATASTAGVISIITSLAGIPEVPADEAEEKPVD